MKNLVRVCASASAVLLLGSMVIHTQDKPAKMAGQKTVKVGKIDPKLYTSALNKHLRPHDTKEGVPYWNGVAYPDGCVCDSDNNLWCKDANGDWQYAGDCSAKTMSSKMTGQQTVKVGKIDPKLYTSALNEHLRPHDAKEGVPYWNGVAYPDGCVCDSDNNLWCKDANGDWQYAGDCKR